MVDCRPIIYITAIFLLIMYPQWSFYIIGFVILYMIYLSIKKGQSQMEFFESNPGLALNSFYADINDNIGKGNPQSWSGLSNPYIDINDRGRQDPIIYQAHGIPLSYEDFPTTPVKDSMF